jgi:hypothetical protein
VEDERRGDLDGQKRVPSGESRIEVEELLAGIHGAVAL